MNTSNQLRFDMILVARNPSDTFRTHAHDPSIKVSSLYGYVCT